MALSRRTTMCRPGAMVAAASMPNGNASTTRGKNRFSAAASTTNPATDIQVLMDTDMADLAAMARAMATRGWAVSPGMALARRFGGSKARGTTGTAMAIMTMMATIIMATTATAVVTTISTRGGVGEC